MKNSSNKTAYQTLFEHSSIGIIVSNQEGTMEQANPFASKMFGYQEGELLGQKIEILIPMELRQKHVENRVDYHKESRPRAMGIGMDLWALKKDRMVFPVEISLAAYETDGKRKIVSFINDITERKKAEQQLKELNTQLETKVDERTNELSQALLELGHINEILKEEMEQRKKIEAEARQAFAKEKDLGELKSRFVSMASHEFRTPLSGVLTSVSLIDRYNQAGDREKINKHIQTIKSSVHSLTGILNDFLSLDKLEAGRVECHPSSFGIAEFAADISQEIGSLCKKDQIILYEHRSGENQVQLDQQFLRNVLINLLSNAIKYSTEGSKIYFTTELQGAEIIITIRDEGIGIPEAEQKHLFERFFRAHNATMIQGTGLGLHIVKKYLDLMGGAICFTSEENDGTTFVVTLPREI